MAENPGDESKNDEKKDLSCYSYEGTTCIYTDPKTLIQYVWSEESQSWVEKSSSGDNGKISIKPSKFSEEDPGVDYVYDGQNYLYTDQKDGTKYKWNSSTSEWVSVIETKSSSEECSSSLVEDLKRGAYDIDKDKHYYTDPNDGTVYEWDREKSAWFPKLDDEFLARYQMSYGFVDESQDSKKEEKPSNPEEDLERLESEKKLLKRKEPPPPPAWFEVDDQHNTKVYVSNLPCDLTETEFVEIMQKCGLVMKDIDNNRMKVKLYMDSNGKFKGDALCSYIKVESVELALSLLDGYDVKGHKIHVERAKFQMKGDSYDAKLRPRKKGKKDKEKMKKMQEKLFDWRPDKMRGERPGNERVVVIKNLFEPGLFDKNAALLLEYREDLREECSKCGNLRKVVIHDRHPEGVAQVYFQDPEEADICLKLLNGRWFGQRRLVAETWDGKTKYRVEETEEEREKRLQNWAKFLESGEGGPGGRDGESTQGKASSATASKSPSDPGTKTEHSRSDSVEKSGAPTDSSGDMNVEDGIGENKSTEVGKESDAGSIVSLCSKGNETRSVNDDVENKGSTDAVSGVKDRGELPEEVPENEGETDSNPEGDSDSDH